MVSAFIGAKKRKKAFPKIQKVIKEEKNNFLKEELNAIKKHERMTPLEQYYHNQLLITKETIK